MSALVLPLHHLLSYPHSPQPCCHSVPAGFVPCPLLSPPSQPHFCFFYHPYGLCSCLSVTGDGKESRRMAVAPSPLHHLGMNRPPKEKELISSVSTVNPVSCNPFKGKCGESSQVRSASHHTMLGNGVHPLGAYLRVAAACHTCSLSWNL